MQWSIWQARDWEDEDANDLPQFVGATQGTPENWLRENMPGVLNFGSDYKVGIEISYTITYQNGDRTNITFTKEG